MGLRDLIFGKRDALSVATMIGFPADGGVGPSSVSATTTLGLSAVWRCIDILSNGVSQLEWRERRGTQDLPLSRVVQRPQAQRTRREWTSLVVSTLALFDVCYLLKTGGLDSEGVPLGLWYLDPQIVMPATADLYTIAFGLPPNEFFVAGHKVSRDQLVILHRSPQPTIPDHAGGIIQLARTTFAAAIAAERYASRYWQAGGPPTTVLETDQRLTTDQVKETSQAWSDKRARGPDFAPVLQGGLKARSFGSDPTSESAVEARKELVADIGRYFGIPTRILNAPTGDTETYSSTPAANGDLVRYTLQNYIGAIEDAITDLLPGGRRMEMAVARLTAGTQFEQAQAYQLATAGRAWMTPEEVRDQTGLAQLDDPLARSLEVPTSLIDQVKAGLRTENEGRELLNLAPIDWGDGLTAEETATLLDQYKAGVLTHDEVRARLGQKPVVWPDELGPDEVASVIDQVKAGLLTENEARALMKRPPVAYAEGPSPDEVSSLVEQVKEGLMTIEEARASLGRPAVQWPEDLSEKVTQAEALIRAGFDPADVLSRLGLPPMKHLGLPPTSVQKLADAENPVRITETITGPPADAVPPGPEEVAAP